VECATRRRARWLSWRAREPQSSQSGFRPRPNRAYEHSVCDCRSDTHKDLSERSPNAGL
jgi:hypothetical protein